MNKSILVSLPTQRQDVKVNIASVLLIHLIVRKLIKFHEFLFFIYHLLFALFKSIKGWHYCDIDGRQASFLCPNGTQFSQAVFVCDWWFNVRCDLSPLLYQINARLYQKPKVNPTQPHRVITKELIENIFN